MKHFKKVHETYLKEKGVKNETELAEHLINLQDKQSTLDFLDRQMMADLIWLMYNEKQSLINFFSTLTYNLPSVNNMLKEEVINVYRNEVDSEFLEHCPKGGINCFCDGSCKKVKVTLPPPTNHKEWQEYLDNVKELKDDVITNSSRGEKEMMRGMKENQQKPKAPVFTYCKVNKNALEMLAFRALYGHDKYLEFDVDWENFTRVPNGDFEYANAEFRHALEIGEEETEEEHLVAAAWNAVARLEIYLRNKQ